MRESTVGMYECKERERKRARSKGKSFAVIAGDFSALVSNIIVVNTSLAVAS